jgi:two-component system KDP operon response regulator KdpE
MLTSSGEVTSVNSVLLVEDDQQIVRAIVPALEVSGLRVKVTTTGQDAMDQVDAASWDALIVDLGLPDMDGKTVIRHLRDRFTTPVVVISAQHSIAEVEAAHGAGADRFLHKPFRTPDLIACIKRLMSDQPEA